MLSAMTASTGACGTCTKAQRCRGQGQAVRDRERGDGADQTSPAAVDENQQGQHEEQVIDSEENVLDSQVEVGPGNLEPAGNLGDDERRCRRRQARDLGGPVEPLESRQHVGHRAGKPVDLDRAADEPSRTGHAPAIGKGASDRVRSDGWRQRSTALGQPGVDPQSKVPAARNFPQDVESLRRGLPQLEVARPHLMRPGCIGWKSNAATRSMARLDQARYPESHRRRRCACSTTTEYRARRP